MRDDEEDEVRSGPGWVVTLFGATLLLAAGFAVGLVVGAVREEPAMLLRYVSGRGSTLQAPPAVEPAPAPASPPRAEAPAETARAVAPSSSKLQTAPAPRPPPAVIAPGTASERPPPVSSAPAARPRFAVQVGAFADSSEAEKLQAQLKRKGLPVYLEPATGARDSRWRVRIGPLASRDEADRVAAKLKAQEKLPVWVLEESG